MTFPLTANAPGDHYRDAGTYSWGSDGDGVVNLPPSIRRVIVEMRTHVLYVNAFVPVTNFTISLDRLTADYDDSNDMTETPVRLQNAAREVWRPAISGPVLANPIEDLKTTGVGDPPVIERLYPPAEMASGDQVFVEIRPVKGRPAVHTLCDGVQGWAGRATDRTGSRPSRTRDAGDRPASAFDADGSVCHPYGQRGPRIASLCSPHDCSLRRVPIQIAV